MLFLGAALALSCGNSSTSPTPARTPSAAAPSAAARPVVSDAAGGGWDVTVRNLNILHGLHCVGQCRLAERVDLAFQWLTRDSCADVITLQEISMTAHPFVIDAARRAVAACGFEYEVVYEPLNTLDDAIILSRYPILDRGVETLDGAFRHVLYAKIDHPAGPVDVFTTHLASDLDLATLGCEPGCPRQCVAAGARTRRECQAVKASRFVESRGGERIIVTGDLNARPGDFEVQHFLAHGFEDAYSSAGNPRCQPTTGVGCSSGRGSDQESLEAPVSRQAERIDYILVRARPGECSVESAGDPDSDGVATGALAHQSNPFSASCGAFPAPPCWPSDHAGVEADWECRPNTTPRVARRAPPVTEQAPSVTAD